ncbi:MAG: tRNA dihydrouridine synthase DusB [Chloroflexi bacterium]|nr:tRNA dihydrouridine synthase DusB [Chloroflexota bacterium]
MLSATNTPSFHIGSVPVTGRALLSPMDGFSDLPFRGLCRRLGSAMSYTEFVSCIDVLTDRHDVGRRLTYEPSERPVVFQIFDDDPARMLEAALRLRDLGPDILDVNMGCSARNITARGAGAGLLQTPARIAAIFKTLTARLELPVTGKIRLGWDDASRNHVEVARILEDNGAALVAVHGRTKAQAYGGRADWDAIAEVKAAVRIPVIGNGDVRTPDDIGRLREHTGCDGVMVGRAAIGNPWIFAGLERAEVPGEEVRRVMLEHLAAMLAFYGPEHGLVLFRKHAKQYISPYLLSNELRTRLLTAVRPEDFTALLDDILQGAPQAV